MTKNLTDEIKIITMTKTNKANRREATMCKLSMKSSFNQRQQGVVLFFSLIALVVMSLAAVALIRSVDTNSMIAGNLAFKRSATTSADSGAESALNWLSDQSIATLQANVLLSGYYATSIDNVATPAVDESNGKQMVEANGVVAVGAGIDANGLDSNGNTITYVVQRMCRAAGAASATNCLMGPGDALASAGNAGVACAASVCTPAQAPIFRITARVVGPKNTVSVIQAFMS